jgi:threonylcarbamoyladenosine tRNA methylthiotransferase MtaB
MQSGSDAVLRRMHRRWGAQRFIDRCQLVREALDRPAFTTDVIVGFPGETEEDFQATCAACEQVGFSKIHIFPFSARRSTPAATMEGQVSPALKADRARRLAVLETNLRARYFESLRGSTLQVLIESVDASGRAQGTACRYAPVELAGIPSHAGRILPVLTTASNAFKIGGVLAAKNAPAHAG